MATMVGKHSSKWADIVLRDHILIHTDEAGIDNVGW